MTAQANVPEGFRRVCVSDLDHLGMWSRAGAGFIDYWAPSNAGVVRRERPVGVAGRQITVVRLRRRKGAGQQASSRSEAS